MRIFSSDFYLGEHLGYGHLGHFFIVLAFVAALLGFVAGMMYFFKPEKYESLAQTARQMFAIHSVAIFGILILLIVMFKLHLFEYHYVWRHSNRELPWYYILSAIWEGQEGSFILWMFWHSVLGLVLMRRFSKLNIGALAVLSLIEAVLATMILGLQLGDYPLGHNPFILLRDEMNIPVLARPDYLNMITDGNGLNALLQNYWMVIHPPVLFLGFASVSIPFVFLAASLLSKDFTDWTKSVSSWAWFSVATLGAGILMGGRWAYEALSFGGFWAWDPVENASFVPWLFMIAGTHTLLVYRATKHSLKATYLFFLLAFFFVLYSTFLTRSGILGDSSVHSFTDLGMSGQLVFFMVLFIIPVALLLAYYWAKIPENAKEENTTSREFWIFLAMIVVALSALQITFTTSIPVWNKLFDLKMAPPVNANQHYNAIQIWFAIFAVSLMGIAPMLSYVKTNFQKIKIPLAISGVGATILSWVLVYFSDIPFFQKYKIGTNDHHFFVQFFSAYFILYIVCIWALVLNLLFFVQMKYYQKFANWGGTLAHLGFVLLILGALISQYQKHPLSINLAGIDFGKEFTMDEQTSNTLLIKGKKEKMNPYEVTYQATIPTQKGALYSIFFQNSKNPSDSFHLLAEGKFIKEGQNSRLQAEPAIKHYLGKDIFTHISSVPDAEEAKNKEKKRSARPGDTLFSSKYAVAFQSVDAQPPINGRTVMQVETELGLIEQGKVVETMRPTYSFNTQTGKVSQTTTESKDGELKIKIDKIDPASEEFVFAVEEKNPITDWIIFKVVEFPQINILWMGCILMVLGALITAYNKKLKIES